MVPAGCGPEAPERLDGRDTSGGVAAGKVVGTVVVTTVVVGKVVVGNVVVGASSESPPPPPPPSPPPPPPLGGSAGEASRGATPKREYSIRLTESLPTSLSTPDVAVLVIHVAIWAGVVVGAVSRPSATTPATCGDAMDVPDLTELAVDEPIHAEVMLEPGAKTSTHEPKFENEDRASADVVAPTVIATGSPAGEVRHALLFEFPAATTNTTPSATPR